MRRSNLIWKAAFLAVLMAFTQVETANAGGEDKSKNAADSGKKSEVKGIETVVLKFEAGESEISEKGKDKIREEMSKLPEGAKAKTALVAAWPDKELPESGSLSKKDKKLSEKRSQNVEKFLKSEGEVTKVQTLDSKKISMMLEDGEKEAEMHTMFGRRSSPEIMKKEMGTIQRNGGPSKAVVVFEVEM